MLGVLRIEKRQQFTRARNAEWIIIDANQATSEKSLCPFVTVHLRHMVDAFGKITPCSTGHVNYALVSAGMCQPYHLLNNLSGREIPRNIPVPDSAIDAIRARLRLARE